MISKILMELKSASTMPCYTGNLDELQLENLIYEKILPLSEYMSKIKNNFILGGDDLCYMDFFLFELCLFFDFITKSRIYQQNDWIEAYVGKFFSDSRLEYYLKNNYYEVQMRPFNMKFAAINNWKDI